MVARRARIEKQYQLSGEEWKFEERGDKETESEVISKLKIPRGFTSEEEFCDED